MFNSKQFRDLIVFPCLNALDLYSEEAENLLVMIMAHESEGGTYLKQVGGGPALGIYQMEGNTFKDLWAWLRNEDNPHHHLVVLILGACNLLKVPVAGEMVGNLYLATCMARIFFLRIKEPIPRDPLELAMYAKRFWNTSKGKATPKDYLNAYFRFDERTAH
jgi:hypothetical protein